MCHILFKTKLAVIFDVCLLPYPSFMHFVTSSLYQWSMQSTRKPNKSTAIWFQRDFHVVLASCSLYKALLYDVNTVIRATRGCIDECLYTQGCWAPLCHQGWKRAINMSAIKWCEWWRRFPVSSFSFHKILNIVYLEQAASSFTGIREINFKGAVFKYKKLLLTRKPR